jgi:hypothetical protein
VTAALVQTAWATSGSTDAHGLVAALDTRATPGSCLVACVAGYDVGAVEAVTSAASQDNWGTAAAVSADDASTTCEIWINPGCTVAASTVTAGVTTSGLLMAQVFEFSGILASSPADVTTTGNDPSIVATSWSSGTSGTYEAGDVLIGMCSANNGSVAFTMTGPSSPWANESYLQASLSGIFARMIAGYQITTGGGTMTYSGTNTGFVRYGAAAIALKAVSGGGSTGSFLPFFA